MSDDSYAFKVDRPMRICILGGGGLGGALSGSDRGFYYA